MRNLILIILTIAVSCGSLAAQNSSLILGINGGTNFSKLGFTGDFSIQGETTSRAIGFQGGVDLGVKFGSFSFLTGFKYVQGGGNTELRRDDPNNPFVLDNGTIDVGVQNTSTSLSMISIPLLLRYESQGDLAFTVSLGPVIHKATGSAKTEITYDLTASGSIGPDEVESTYGDLGNDLFSTGSVGFMFSPGVLYKLNDNGRLRFNLTYATRGTINNDNYLVADALGVRKVSGSIKSNAIMFEIGYEHRIDFNFGSQY